MNEFIQGLSTLTFWEKIADLHGTMSMLSLILFGAALVLYKVSTIDIKFLPWLKNILLLLFSNLLFLDFVGLTIYAPYRTTEVLSPRTILKSSEATSWLHTIVFEHKEFLAFAPPLIILVAYLVTSTLGNKFNSKQMNYLRYSIIFSLVISLVLVLLVAGEAVLVTKAQPLK